MIDDFERVKKELTELATVLNTFKSEAVQVRIVELLLGINETTVDDETPAGSPIARPMRKTKRKTTNKVTQKEETTKPRRVATSPGPIALLSQLLAGDFFNSPKTIGDIVEHCKHNFARTIKPSDISGKLARLTRDQTLRRSKNSDGQYEYVNP